MLWRASWDVQPLGNACNQFSSRMAIGHAGQIQILRVEFSQPSPHIPAPPRILAATIMGKSLFQKVWDSHRVGTLGDGRTRLFIGTHLIHEVTSPQAFGMLRDLGLKVKFPQRTFATIDHIVPTINQGQPADPLSLR